MATREELEYLVRVNDRDLKELQRNVKSTNTALDKDLGKASSSADDHLRKVNRGALLAATGLAAGLGFAAKNAWEELSNSQKVGAQTTAVLKSTGGQARVTGKDVGALATQISNYSGIDDEAVQSGENMLLTFTNIRNEAGKGNDIFNQSTSILADMSTAMGTDMNKSAIQLGKALNDPIKGVTALTKVGVTFDEATKKQIKTLVEHGKSTQAQKIILHELNKEFGGSAKAAGDTLPGQLNKARNAFDNMSADLLKALIPAISSLAGWLSKATQFMQGHEHATKIVIAILAGLALTVFAVNAGMKVYAAGVTIAKLATAGLGEQATITDKLMRLTLIGMLITLGTLLVIAYLKSKTFRDVVNKALRDVADAAIWLRSKAEAIWHGFEETLGWVRAHWPLIAALIAGPFAPIVLLATNAFGVRSALTGAFDAVKTFVRNTVGDIAGFFKALPGRIGDAIGAGIGALKTKLASVFDWHRILKWIKDALDFHSPAPWAVTIGEDIVASIAHGVGKSGDVLKNAVFALAKKIPGAGIVRGAAGAIGGLFGGGGGSSAGLAGTDSRVQNAVHFAEKMGWHGSVTSGFRTYAEQAALYQRYLAGGPLAARPGTSSHEKGEAVDVSDYGTFGRIMQMLPPGLRLNNYLGARDPVHFSVSGYADGGIVPGPIGAPQLAVVHGGEKITPPGELHDGPLVHIENANFGTPLDAELLASSLMRKLAFR